VSSYRDTALNDQTIQLVELADDSLALQYVSHGVHEWNGGSAFRTFIT
jgi:hypothetical protein